MDAPYVQNFNMKMVFQNPICIFFVKMQIEKYLEQIGFLLNGSTDEYQTLVHTTKFNLLMSFRHLNCLS